ncbi:MAG: hypothetical protein ACUZ8A_08005 [Candidatus Bathyanammoxibius sp.]
MSKKKGTFDKGPKASPRPRIPEGECEAYCFDVRKSKYLGNEKRLYVWYRITEGKYEGTELFCSYNINYKSFSTNTKYYTDWCIASGRLPTRGDRMSPQVFKNKVFLVKVREAKPKYDDGTYKPEIFWYSVVDRIASVSAG